ncbi:MAG: hypothetical protein WBA20_17670 [Ketobacter sp.]|nr:MAG: hypothetical protein D6160_08880 [Ketobacter sp.]
MKNSLILGAIVVTFLYFYSINGLPFQERIISYGEARYALDFPQRDVELVAIGQRFDTGKCEKNSVIDEVYKICENSPNCSEIKYECKSKMESEYQRMFNLEQASTHYVHMQDMQDKLAGVILLWGLTKQESLGFCQSLVGNFLAKKDDDFTMRCI